MPAMLMHEPSPADHELLVGEIAAMGANAGTCILLDQSLRTIASRRRPIGSRRCSPGAATRRSSRSRAAVAGRSAARGELVVFEQSGHCPMWEEPERFNQVVGDWISEL